MRGARSSGRAAGERGGGAVEPSSLPVDEPVGLATAAVYAAYRKLAARFFNGGAQTRCTFIFILKLYVTDTACIAKWRPLKHNDYETIIIWRSTRGGPRPKCSLCVA